MVNTKKTILDNFLYGDKIVQAYEEYAPKNITLEQFAEMVEQDPYLMKEIENNTLGEFSTLNPKLAKVLKPISFLTSSDSKKMKRARTVLADTMEENKESMKVRLNKIKEIYKEIICSNDDILTAAWTFDLLDDQEKQKLAIDIVNALNKYFNISEKIDIRYDGKHMYNQKMLLTTYEKLPTNFLNSVSAFVVALFSNYDDDPVLLDLQGNGYHRPPQNFDKESKIRIGTCYYFPQFINILAHEYGHFIDYQYPNLGMIGAQIMYARDLVYGVDYGREYGNGKIMNPSEISSYAIGDSLESSVDDMLKKQAKKRPSLYIKTVKLAVDKYKARYKSLNFEYEKLYDKYRKLRDKVINQKYPDYHDLPDREQISILKEIINKNLHIRLLVFKIKQLIVKWKQFYDTRLEHYEDTIVRMEQEFNLQETLIQDTR